MKVRFCIWHIYMTLLLISHPVLAAEDDNQVLEYPDGDFGIQLGGGYEVMPDGEFMPPGGYREEYRDTRYGPMVGEGFVDFPGFSFVRPKKGAEKEEKREEEEKEYIFEQSPAAGPQSIIWGVSTPRNKKSKEED